MADTHYQCESENLNAQGLTTSYQIEMAETFSFGTMVTMLEDRNFTGVYTPVGDIRDISMAKATDIIGPRWFDQVVDFSNIFFKLFDTGKITLWGDEFQLFLSPELVEEKPEGVALYRHKTTKFLRHHQSDFILTCKQITD
jgi:hypothetical protein